MKRRYMLMKASKKSANKSNLIEVARRKKEVYKSTFLSLTNYKVSQEELIIAVVNY